MKLHLPKLLRVAVMVAACGLSYAESGSENSTSSNMYINVGYAKYPEGEDNQFNCPNTYLVEETDENGTTHKVLKVGSGDLVGLFTVTDETPLSADKFVTSFQTYGAGAIGSILVSSSMIIDGNLEIGGSGKVYIGGKSNSNFYAYLEAEDVHITGTATGTNSGSNSVQSCGGLNLRADSAKFETLTMDGGAAFLCTYESGGGDDLWPLGPAIDDSCKSVYITDGMTINKGYLQMGYKTSEKNLTSVTSHFRTFLSGEIEQNGGTVVVNGKVYLGGPTITQTGGTMTLSANAEQERVVFAKAMTIKQVESQTASVSSSSEGPTLNINGIMAAGSSSGKAKQQVAIIQECKGTININKGAIFTSDADKASTITQNHEDAKISLTGDYTSAIFDVNQSKGILTLKSNAKLAGNKATINGSLKIESGASLVTKELNLSKSTQITNSGSLVAGAAAPASTTADAIYVTEGGSLNLADGYGTQTEGAMMKVKMDGGSVYVNGSATLDSLKATGGSVNMLVGTPTEKQGLLTFNVDTTGGTASFDMGTGSAWNLYFSEAYLAGITTANTSLNITVATTTGVFDESYKNAALGISGVDERIWAASGLTVSSDTAMQNISISGTLVKKSTVEINTSDEVTTEITDITGTPVSMKITEDVTISSENTHTGGTTIENADVTSENAGSLGNGLVKTTGTSSIISGSDDAGNPIETKLTKAVENSGSLTMSGAFTGDSTKFDTVRYGETYVDVAGNEGVNGYYRAAGEGYLVVKNDTGATLTVEKGTYFVTGSDLHTLLQDGSTALLDYTTYYIEESDHEVKMSDILKTSGGVTPSIDMEAGTLTADKDVENLMATGGKLLMQNSTVDGYISGATSVEVVSGSKNILKGDNDYTGYTNVAKQATLTVGEVGALGKNAVTLQDRSTLDVNHLAVKNDLLTTGNASLMNAENYKGNITVEGTLGLVQDASANKVTLTGTGSLKNTSLTVNIFEMASGATGEVGTPQYANTPTNLHLNPNGTIILNDGTVLTVIGSATLGAGVQFVLNGNSWQAGDVLMTASKGINTMRAGQYSSQGTVVLSYGRALYVVNGNQVILTNIFNQNKADVAAQSNWGIATTSRAFVNTVRGQHSNTGCIADGRGTVWAAAFGAYNDLDGSDIDVKGAAVGVDAKVGSCSTVGIAFGYAEGEVSPTGLRDADQEGEYVALYGSHGLKKLSSTSCLSLDWVAAYGNTESEWNSLKWEQDSLQLNTRLNWNKKVTERLGMSVFGGLEYFATGSDTADGVKSGSIQNLRGEIGVGARYVAWGTPASQPVLDEKGATLAAARPGCEKLVLNGEIRYFNDMVRSNPVIEMDGLRGGGENPGRQGMGIEAGATYRISERWSASANYSFNAMEDSVEHRANVGASYTF